MDMGTSHSSSDLGEGFTLDHGLREQMCTDPQIYNILKSMLKIRGGITIVKVPALSSLEIAGTSTALSHIL